MPQTARQLASQHPRTSATRWHARTTAGLTQTSVRLRSCASSYGTRRESCDLARRLPASTCVRCGSTITGAYPQNALFTPEGDVCASCPRSNHCACNHVPGASQTRGVASRSTSSGSSTTTPRAPSRMGRPPRPLPTLVQHAVQWTAYRSTTQRPQASNRHSGGKPSSRRCTRLLSCLRMHTRGCAPSHAHLGMHTCEHIPARQRDSGSWACALTKHTDTLCQAYLHKAYLHEAYLHKAD